VIAANRCRPSTVCSRTRCRIRDAQTETEDSKAGESGALAAKKETMALANLRVVKDRQTTQNLARGAIEAHNARFDERIRPWPIPVCNGSYLDIDAILARSLPEVFRPQLHAGSRKESLVSAEATRVRFWRSTDLTPTPAKKIEAREKEKWKLLAHSVLNWRKRPAL
jgi:hypothetical protein